MAGREDLFQQAMNQGHSAAWDQAWGRAASYYRQALEFFPNHPRALTSLGLALLEQQKFGESLKAYIGAARLTPDDPLPLEKAAQLYECMGNKDRASVAAMQAAELYLKSRDVNKAIENWQHAVRMKPDSLQPRARLAVVFERMGEKDAAVAEYLALASIYQAVKATDKANEAVHRALLAHPESADARRASELLKDFKPLPRPALPPGGNGHKSPVKRLEPAGPAVEGESGLDPVAEARQKALTVLAGMLFDGAEGAGSERPSSSNTARRGFAAMLRGSGSVQAVDSTKILLHLSQVVDLQTRDQASQAAEELERAVEAGLDHPAAYFDLGLLQSQAGQPERATRNLQNAASHPDFALAARLLLGQSLRATGRCKDASVYFLEALGLADAQVVPENQAVDMRQLYDPLIEAQRQKAESDSAERLCENIAKLLLRPGWREHLIQARRKLPNRLENGPLVPLAEAMIEARGSQAVEAISRIYELEHAGYLNSAMEEAFYALQYAPTYLPLHIYMGELLLKKGHVHEASSKFMQVAHSYGLRGEAGRSLEMYRRVIDVNPVDVKPRLRLINQLTALGKTEEAIQAYMDAADVYYSLADLEMVRQTYHQAYRLAQTANVNRSWKVKILHRLADLDLQSLDWRHALRVFEQIRTLQPEDDKARSYLVVLNFRLGQDTGGLNELDNYISFLVGSGKRSKAIEFLENLVREDENRAPLRRRLAELYMQMGRKQEAIAQYDAIGEMLLDAGDHNGAAQVVEKILSLNPENLGEYNRLLEQVKENA